MTKGPGADGCRGGVKPPLQFQVADQVGGGFGGFFDFVDAVSGEAGTGEMVGENVGVGVNHTKQIVDGMGNDFGARRRMDGVWQEVEAEIGVGAKWGRSFSVADEGKNGLIQDFGGEVVQGKATGCAGLESESGEIDEVLSGRVQEDEDGE